MAPDDAAELAKVIQPQIAVPMHYGFVVGSRTDGDRFRDLASPVRVELLTPENPFERRSTTGSVRSRPAAPAGVGSSGRAGRTASNRQPPRSRRAPRGQRTRSGHSHLGRGP